VTLQATVRAGFAKIMTAMASAVVAVISNGEETTGLRGTQQSASGMSDEGDRGKDTCIVRVDASTLSTPADGATIIVDGENVTVSQTRLDPVGALLWIDYMVTKPVTEG